jgi:hypothetical protein
MTIQVTSPITGSAMSQFATPSYTLVADKGPDVNANQWIVSALGGTQTSVRTHSVSDPFTITVTRPKAPRVLPAPNAVTGKYQNVPKNTYAIRVRKGVNFAANNAPVVATLLITVDVPAGSDAFDSANLRAMVCAGLGALAQQSQGLGDTLANGVI